MEYFAEEPQAVPAAVPELTDDLQVPPVTGNETQALTQETFEELTNEEMQE